MNDLPITALTQAEINDALAQLKQLSEYPTPSTQYARVLLKYIASLVEALEKAQQRIDELENAAAEPVALRWRWNDNDAQWTYAPASRMPEFVAAGFTLENGVVVESLYTVSPTQESRTVTVKLPDSFYPDGDIEAPLVMNEYQVIEALVAAGCKPVAVCPRCKRELDLSVKHDGAHYCHLAAGIQVIEGE